MGDLNLSAGVDTDTFNCPNQTEEIDLDVETHLDSSATEMSSKPTSIHKHKSEDVLS